MRLFEGRGSWPILLSDEERVANLVIKNMHVNHSQMTTNTSGAMAVAVFVFVREGLTHPTYFKAMSRQRMPSVIASVSIFRRSQPLRWEVQKICASTGSMLGST